MVIELKSSSTLFLLLLICSGTTVLGESQTEPEKFNNKDTFTLALRLQLRERFREKAEDLKDLSIGEKYPINDYVLTAFALAHCLEEQNRLYCLFGSELDSDKEEMIKNTWKLFKKINEWISKPNSSHHSIAYIEGLWGGTLYRLRISNLDKSPHRQIIWDVIKPRPTESNKGNSTNTTVGINDIKKQIDNWAKNLAINLSNKPRRKLNSSYGYSNNQVNDLSNLQFRVLSFHFLKELRRQSLIGDWGEEGEWIRIMDWGSIAALTAKYFVPKSSNKFYGYGYHIYKNEKSPGAYLSMTAAGVCNIVLAARHSNLNRPCGETLVQAIKKDSEFQKNLKPIKLFSESLKSLIETYWGNTFIKQPSWRPYALYSSERSFIYLGIQAPPPGYSTSSKFDFFHHGVNQIERLVGGNVFAQLSKSLDKEGLAHFTPRDFYNHLVQNKDKKLTLKSDHPGAGIIMKDYELTSQAFLSVFLEKGSDLRQTVQQLTIGSGEHFHGLVSRWALFEPTGYIYLDHQDNQNPEKLFGQMGKSPLLYVCEPKFTKSYDPKVWGALGNYLAVGGTLIFESTANNHNNPEQSNFDKKVTRMAELWAAQFNTGGKGFVPIREDHPIVKNIISGFPKKLGGKDGELTKLIQETIHVMPMDACRDSVFYFRWSPSCWLTAHCEGPSNDNANSLLSDDSLKRRFALEVWKALLSYSKPERWHGWGDQQKGLITNSNGSQIKAARLKFGILSLNPSFFADDCPQWQNSQFSGRWKSGLKNLINSESVPSSILELNPEEPWAGFDWLIIGGRFDETKSKVDESKAKTDESKVKTDEAKVKTDKAKVKTDEAKVKTDEAKVKTDKAKVKTDKAKIKTDETKYKSKKLLKDKLAQAVNSGANIYIECTGQEDKKGNEEKKITFDAWVKIINEIDGDNKSSDKEMANSPKNDKGVNFSEKLLSILRAKNFAFNKDYKIELKAVRELLKIALNENKIRLWKVKKGIIIVSSLPLESGFREQQCPSCKSVWDSMLAQIREKNKFPKPSEQAEYVRRVNILSQKIFAALMAPAFLRSK